ncbi:Guanine nucleotide-binding protein subunit alpha [Mycena venus]|uniref:Guanine nucleotide-binding protein subunit alpha n=1 Tax=Mycena venus TaxID=2733690 RepID=A0A8H6YKK5_9AGAR|nr:Guanine nucleotide-binding protein subunit alpha [Mycena venus]
MVWGTVPTVPTPIGPVPSISSLRSIIDVEESGKEGEWRCSDTAAEKRLYRLPVCPYSLATLILGVALVAMGQAVSKEACVDKAPRSDKILLLGSGECGKSTIMKRMKIYQGGFDAPELAKYRTMIYNNVLDSAGTFARVIRRVGVGALEEGERVIYAARSDAIDQQIMEDSKRYRKECKVLLLGLCGSGKRTIVKQMKIHHGGFDARELAEYRTTIYENVLSYAGSLALVVRQVCIGTLEEKDRVHAAQLLAAFPMADAQDGEYERRTVEARTPMAGVLTQTHTVLTPTLADAIWHVACVLASKCLLEHPIDFYSMDSALYILLSPSLMTTFASHFTPASPPFSSSCPSPLSTFLLPLSIFRRYACLPPVAYCPSSPTSSPLSSFFASIHRIAAPTYVPSDEDILRIRTMSTAIIETRFSMGDLSIHMFDVSGQRSERKKWIHCFESVTSIIFCTALSEYDEPFLEQRGPVLMSLGVDNDILVSTFAASLRASGHCSRLRESLYLFESVINSRWFLRTSVILLMNKIMEFKRKLPKIPLEHYFPEYTGGNDLQKAAKFILWKFMQENRAKLTVYPHVMQVTDTNTIRLVFAAIKETILNNALKDSGIL